MSERIDRETEAPGVNGEGPSREEIEADERQTERQAPNDESPGVPASHNG